MNLILASQSPRRKKILTEFGYNFSVMISNFEEKDIGSDPVLTSVHNAEGKAKEIFDNLSQNEKENSVVVGADTVVLINGKLLEKPKSKEEAKQMLNTLSNNTHQVYTGFCIIAKDKEIKDVEKTEVVFKRLEKSLIDEYVASGKPMDKAGAYGVQDGYDLVEKYNGSYFNVVGLPIERIKPIIDKLLLLK